MDSNASILRFVTETAGGWWRDVRLAGAFLTRLPVGGAVAMEAPLAAAARAFPLVGVGVGAVGAGVLLGAWWLGLHPLAAALLGIGAQVLLTGALHEDGLGDVADGFGGGRTLAEKLAIMRDSRIGTYGVLAVVFSVGMRAAVLSGMIGPGAAAGALLAAGAASRGVLPAVMHWLDPARPDGMAEAAGRPARPDAITAAVLGGLLALFFLLFFLEPAAGIAALVAAAFAAALAAAFARAQVGGHTGDVLGAVQQVTEIAVLVAVAALGP